MHNGWNIFERIDKKYLITGSNRDTFSHWNAYSCLINSQGEIDSVHQYNLPTGFGSTCNNGIATEYGYVLSGLISHNEQPLSAQCYVIRITPDGGLIDTVWVGKQYSQSNSITRTFDGGYLLGGYSRAPTDFIYRPYLLRLNADMEVVWDSTYIVPVTLGTLGMFRKLIADTTNHTYYALAAFGNDPSNLVWIHLSEQGEVLDQRIFLGQPYDVINDIASISILGRVMNRCKDGDFLIAFAPTQLDAPIAAHLVKMSPDGDTIRWNEIIYDVGYIAKVEELADGSWVLGGGVHHIQADNIPYQTAVAHVSKDGDLLWKRVYGGSRPDYIYDFIITSDGSYLFTGRTESPELGVSIDSTGNGGANVYLLKTNCMGLLTLPQANFTTQIDSAALTASFQNLSQFVYPDSIDGGRFIWDFGDGATSSELNPTHTYTQGGSYAVTLTAVVCSDTSVFVQTVSTWATGIATTNLHKPMFSTFIPNPTNNTSTLWYNLAEKEIATIAIFDLNGHKITTSTVQGKGNYVFDAATCQTGIYMYTITVNGNVLERNKLIVVK